jgi:LacI family transcriptional regulator
MSKKLEDIARLAGVSRSTVSRVVNNHPHVRDATRQRVLQVIRQQNFHPNPAARALATHRTRALSLVIPVGLAFAFNDPYFPILTQGVVAKANQHDYALMLWVGDGAEEEERLCDRILSNSLFDGVIIASAVDEDPLVPQLVQAGFPFVLVGRPSVDNVNYVDVDNVEGARAAVSHLLWRGRRRIGTITGPLNMCVAQDRLKGYRQALEQAGQLTDETLIVEGDFGELSGHLGMETLLQKGVDAVFAASDTMACGALRAIQEEGLRVPDDVALVGFDDLPVAATTVPPLTTVRQPIWETGAVATDMLIDLLNGAPREGRQIILPAQLIVRGTGGAVHT